MRAVAADRIDPHSHIPRRASALKRVARCLWGEDPGCTLHLRDAAGLELEVKHVAEVLAEALAQHRAVSGQRRGPATRR